MQRYILNRNELKKIIRKFILNEDLEDDIFSKIEYFEVESIGLSYFLSKILEQYSKNDKNCHDILQKVYDLENYISFNIQEFEADFIFKLIASDTNDYKIELLRELEIAKRFNNEVQEEKVREKISLSFEDELVEFCKNYYR